eukprot:TRINITY_DN4105_c0_g1_i10.p1 TRINITY_DN4105_c0_g1~~TRINITY_DN4105_c0_g1_i10.p1  ORF type:complete len:368 (-),score=54.94 TRINITY_DN4105_c0_g1_i10:1003-2106(-)
MYNYPSDQARDHDKGLPYYQYPKIIDGFSLDGDRQANYDWSQFQWLDPAQEKKLLNGNIQLNLDSGFNTRIPRLEREERLDYMLQWILHNREKFEKDFGSDFICYRGVLRKIMCIPYERNEGLIIRAMKWRNTVFLCEEPTKEKKNKIPTEKELRFSYWGYKFEDYMMTSRTSQNQNSESQSEERLNENTEFNCVFRTKLGKYRLLFIAEMDGYYSADKNTPQQTAAEKGAPSELKPSHFVELKTSRQIEHPGQDRTLRKFKTLKWWTQCFLVGTENVLVGWRDDDGIVHSGTKFPVKSLPKSALEWKGNVCANILLQVLEFLSKTIQENSLTRVWRLEWFPHQGFQLKVETDGTEPFLAAWFHSNI